MTFVVLFIFRSSSWILLQKLYCKVPVILKACFCVLFLVTLIDRRDRITFHNSAILLIIDAKIADLDSSISTQPQQRIAFQGQTEVSWLAVSRCGLQAVKIRISINAWQEVIGNHTSKLYHSYANIKRDNLTSLQLTLYWMKCKRETIYLFFFFFLLFACFIPAAGLVLLDATRRLFNWVTVQFCTVFCSSHRKQQATEYASSRGWVWQACAGLDPPSLPVVFSFVGFVEQSFLQGGMYNHTLSAHLSVRFLPTLFLAPQYLCYHSMKKMSEYVRCV